MYDLRAQPKKVRKTKDEEFPARFTTKEELAELIGGGIALAPAITAPADAANASIVPTSRTDKDSAKRKADEEGFIDGSDERSCTNWSVQSHSLDFQPILFLSSLFFTPFHCRRWP